MWIKAAMVVLLATIIDGSGRSTSRNGAVQLLTRPRPVIRPSGDRVMPLPLLEDPGDYTRPQNRDLNEVKLRRRLGNSFEEHWMSIREPTTDTVNEVVDQRQNRHNTWLRRQLNSLNLSRDASMLNLSTQEVRSLESWLMWKAGCAVIYKWADIGPLFWPRWVKQGTCLNKPCSWPEGMTCVQGDSTNIRLLRWHCRGRQTSTITNAETQGRVSGGVSKGRQCKWLKVPYPIMTQCICSCT